MNDFVKQRMDWLIAIAADPKQRGRLPINVAVMLAAKYFNSESGKAWPGIETLAKNLNTDQRNARRAIDWLVASGYLRRSRNRKSGAGHSNTYEMRVKKEGLSTPTNGHEGGSIDPKRRVYRPEKEGLSTPRTLEEPKMNPGSRRARERSPGSGSREEARLSKSSSAYRASADFRPARLTTFPPGLKFGEAHAREASRIVGWDRERAQREFERCRVWHLEHVTRRARWDGAWQSWCETGKDIDARNATRDAARRPRQKDFEAAQGASSWLERRRAAKASGAKYVSNEEPEHVVEEVDDD